MLDGWLANGGSSNKKSRAQQQLSTWWPKKKERTFDPAKNCLQLHCAWPAEFEYLDVHQLDPRRGITADRWMGAKGELICLKSEPKMARIVVKNIA